MALFLTSPRILASFSNWLALRVKDTSRLPEASPASTRVMNRSENTLRCSLMASAREEPFSMDS